MACHCNHFESRGDPVRTETVAKCADRERCCPVKFLPPNHPYLRQLWSISNYQRTECSRVWRFFHQNKHGLYCRNRVLVCKRCPEVRLKSMLSSWVETVPRRIQGAHDSWKDHGKGYGPYYGTSRSYLLQVQVNITVRFDSRSGNCYCQSWFKIK